MYEDTGAGLREDFELQVKQWFDKHFPYGHYRFWVYKPNEEATGLDDQTLEMLNIPEDKRGLWRIKVSATQANANASIAHFKAQTPPPLLVPEFEVKTYESYFVAVLEIDLNNVLVKPETFSAIRAKLTEDGIRMTGL